MLLGVIVHHAAAATTAERRTFQLAAGDHQLCLRTAGQALTASPASPAIAILALRATAEGLIGDVHVQQIHTLLGEQLAQAMHLPFQGITHPGIGAGEGDLGLVLVQADTHLQAPQLGRVEPQPTRLALCQLGVIRALCPAQAAQVGVNGCTAGRRRLPAGAWALLAMNRLTMRSSSE